MGESREALLVAADRCYADSVERAIEVHDTSSEDPVRAGIAAAIEMAEDNPDGARSVLWKLQSDWEMLERLQERLGGEPTLSALRIGAAIHIARSELASPSPHLRERLPEILSWLESEN